MRKMTVLRMRERYAQAVLSFQITYVCAGDDPKYVKERKLLSLLEKMETLDKFDRGVNTVVVRCHYNVKELTYEDQDKDKHLD